MYNFHCWIVIQNQRLDQEVDKEIISMSERDAKMSKLISVLKERLNRDYGFYHPIFERKQKRINVFNKILPFLKLRSATEGLENYKLFGNGLGSYTHLHFTGQRNHKGTNNPELETLEWIRINLPFSYGLLYIYDDENKEKPDEFDVYRLSKNQITKHKDHYLSPFSEIVDKGYHEH